MFDSNIIIAVILAALIIVFIVLVRNQLNKKEYHGKLVRSGIKDIDKMDGLQFEAYLKALFKELGYKSDVTKGSNDFGADLIMKNKNKKIVIQAKRYKYKTNVSIDAVQQVYASMPFYKAQEAWIVTNSMYTKSAYLLAKSCNVKLLDRYKLVDFINKANPDVTPKKIKNSVAPEKRKCPDCKNFMVIRKNKNGDSFFGCSNYPNCKHTEPIAR